MMALAMSQDIFLLPIVNSIDFQSYLSHCIIVTDTTYLQF